MIITIKSKNKQNITEIKPNILDQYYRRLYKNAYFFVNNREDSEDLVQSTFLDYFKNRENFGNRSSLYTYLYSILYNKVKKYYLKKKYLSFKIKDVNQINFETENIYQKFEKKEIIEKSINQMTLKYKVLLILRYYENLSYMEISEILGWKIGTVKSRLWKANKILKKKLESYND